MADTKLRVELTGSEQVIASVAKINSSLASLEQFAAQSAANYSKGVKIFQDLSVAHTKSMSLYKDALAALERGEGQLAKQLKGQAAASEQAAAALRTQALEVSKLGQQYAEYAEAARKAAFQESQLYTEVKIGAKEALLSARNLTEGVEKSANALSRAMSVVREGNKELAGMRTYVNASMRGADQNIFAKEEDQAKKKIQHTKELRKETDELAKSYKNLSEENQRRVALGLKPLPELNARFGVENAYGATGLSAENRRARRTPRTPVVIGPSATSDEIQRRTMGVRGGSSFGIDELLRRERTRTNVEYTPDRNPPAPPDRSQDIINLSAENRRRRALGLRPQAALQGVRNDAGWAGGDRGGGTFITRDQVENVKRAETAFNNLTPKIIAGNLASRALYQTFSAIGEGLGELTIGSGQYAARVEQLKFALDAVAKSSNVAKTEANAVVLALRAQGITTLEARQQTARLMASEMDHAKAMQLGRAAQNLGRVANIASAEAFERLTHAIVTGQPELLRLLGLNVSFEQAYKNQARLLKTTVDGLDAQTRSNIRVNATLEAASKYMGAYEASNESVGGRLLQVRRYVDELKLAIGDRLLPIVRSATDGLIEFLKSSAQFLNSEEKIVDRLNRRALNAVQPGNGYIGGLAKQLDEDRKAREAQEKAEKELRGSARDSFNTRAANQLEDRMRLEDQRRNREEEIRAEQRRKMQASLKSSSELVLEAQKVELGGIAGVIQERDRQIIQLTEYINKYGELTQVELRAASVANQVRNEAEARTQKLMQEAEVRGAEARVSSLKSTDEQIAMLTERLKKLGTPFNEEQSRTASDMRQQIEILARFREKDADDARSRALQGAKDRGQIIRNEAEEEAKLIENIATIRGNIEAAAQARIRKEREKTHDEIIKRQREVQNTEASESAQSVARMRETETSILEATLAAELITRREYEDKRLAIIQRAVTHEAEIRAANVERIAKIEEDELVKDERRKKTDQTSVDAMVMAIRKRAALEVAGIRGEAGDKNSNSANDLDTSRKLRDSQARWALTQLQRENAVNVLEFDQTRADIVRDRELQNLELIQSNSLKTKLYVESQKLRIEQEYIEKRLKAEKDLIDTKARLEISAYEYEARNRGESSELVAARVAELKKGAEEAKARVTETAQGGVAAAQQRANIERMKLYREYAINTFNSIKSAAGSVFDALTRRNQSFAEAIGNALKTAILTALRQIVTSQIAARFTKLLTGQSVGFESNSTGGIGRVLSNWGLGGLPIVRGGPQAQIAAPQGQPIAQGRPRFESPYELVASAGGSMPLVRKQGYGGIADQVGGSSGAILGSLGPGGTSGFAGPLSGLGGGLGNIAISRTLGSTVSNTAANSAALASANGITAVPGLVGVGMNKAGELVPLVTPKSVAFPKSGFGTSGMGQIASGAALAGGSLLATWGLNRGGWAGAGATVAGGAMIGFALGGPIGAGIGAAVGAAAALVRALIKTPEERVQKLVKQRYGLDINKQFAKTIVDLAKSKYNGDYALAIQTKEIREMLELYAASTGQRFTAAAAPRPYGFSQSGTSITQQAYSRFGVDQPLAATDFSRVRTSGLGGPGTLSISLDPAQTDRFLSGQLVSTVTSNPRAVQASSTKAMASNSGRFDQAASMLTPGAIKG